MKWQNFLLCRQNIMFMRHNFFDIGDEECQGSQGIPDQLPDKYSQITEKVYAFLPIMAFYYQVVGHNHSFIDLVVA